MIKYAILAGLMVSSVVVADVPPDQKAEVEYLLELVRATDCAIERNGKQHTAEEAHELIKKKYHYFQDRIRSNEDFIDYSATKSTMSSQHYMLLCAGKPPQPIRDWLTDELRDYRKEHSEPAVGPTQARQAQ